MVNFILYYELATKKNAVIFFKALLNMDDLLGFELCCGLWETFSRVALLVITGVLCGRSLPRERLGDIINGLIAHLVASDAFPGISVLSQLPLA